MNCSTVCWNVRGLLNTIILLCISWNLATGNKVVPSCPASAEVCEFDFVLEHSITMTMKAGEIRRPVRIKGPGEMYARKDRGCDDTDMYRLTQQEMSEVVTADGSYKLAMLINGQLPGPPIIMYEGQQIVVNLTNKLVNEATTLHFHGLEQHNTPWMDGAGGVSQCPITVGQSFTYRTLASPAGTHWYHSHYGTQRTMGVHGPLIVLDRNEEDTKKKRDADPLPVFDGDFFLLVQDWMREDSLDVFERISYDMVSYAFGYDNDTCFNSTKQADGLDCGVTPFISGLINGKGHHYDHATDEIENINVPLEVFTVNRNRKYRFRAVCSSMTFAFELSIDGHPLHIVASDGHNVITQTVDSVIIFPGERYDFWIEASDPENVGNYWVRAETLEREQNGKPIMPGHVEAILRYEGEEKVDPETTKRNCTEDMPCSILNCPFREFPDKEHKLCIPVTDLRSTLATPTMGTEPEEEIEEHFLNYHFMGLKTHGTWLPSVNGFKNIMPDVPPQVSPTEVVAEYCSGECSDLCECTHRLKVPLDKVIQLVFTTTLLAEDGRWNGNVHPVHLHGHQFEVVKMGYAQYNNDTKIIRAFSPDIRCKNGSRCNTVEWTNSSWSRGHVPDVISSAPPLKDTVVVPIGGYVVIRFRTSNPGFWYMHCHIEFHNEEGMGMYIQAGDIQDMNPAPQHIKTCGSFIWTQEEFLDKIDNPGRASVAAVEPPCVAEVTLYRSISLGLGAACVFLACLSLFIYCRYKHDTGYTYIG